MRTRLSPEQVGGYSPTYQKRRAMPVPKGFIAVANERRRHPLVHVVRGETFGEVARLVMRGEQVRTLCEKGTLGTHWSLIGRNPKGGYLVSCADCRARMLEGIDNA